MNVSKHSVASSLEGDSNKNNNGKRPLEPTSTLAAKRTQLDAYISASRALESKESTGLNILTIDALVVLETSAFKNFQLTSFRQLCQAFGAICHMGDEEKKTEFKFQIKNAEVYNALMNVMLFKTHEGFAFHLKDALLKKMRFSQKRNVGATMNRNIVNYKHSAKWSKLRPLICSFVINYIYMMENHSDENVLLCALKCLSQYIPFLVSLQSLKRKVLRCLLKIWSNNKNENIVILAFIRIRQLATTSEQSFTENIMKNLYLSYVRNSKFSGSGDVRKISIMRRCVIELYKLDLKSASQCAFVYIRQLGVHVRNALKDKSKDSWNQVYNSQYLNSLRLWVTMIAYSKTEELRPLCFPLVQIVLSSIRLSSSACFFPFRLHCVELLVLLESSYDITIPVIPLLLELLDDSNIHSNKNHIASLKLPDLESLVKATPAQTRSRQFKDMILIKAFEILESHFALYKTFSAFPEMSYVPICSLKKLQRKLRTPRWRQMVKALIFRLEKWSLGAKSLRYAQFNIDKSIRCGSGLTQIKCDQKTKTEKQFELFINQD